MPQAVAVDDHLLRQPVQDSTRETMRRYRRIVSHIICTSLGYACPSTAARILDDARNSRSNWCEWISACYGHDPKLAVQQAISTRHYHKGFMAEYTHARALVERALADGTEPTFASWF